MAQKVVVDVSKSGQHSPETLEGMRQEALSALENGNTEVAQEIMNVVAEIKQAESEPAVQILDLTEEEEEQREKDAVEFRKLEVMQQRIERNARLAASDWTQLNDSPLTPPKKNEWAKYRQQLRNLSFDGPEIKWPKEPSA